MTAARPWTRVILEAQLNSLGDLVSSDFAHDVQPEIDSDLTPPDVMTFPSLLAQILTQVAGCGSSENHHFQKDQLNQLVERCFWRSLREYGLCSVSMT